MSKDYKTVLRNALENARTVTAERGCGCGRVYVCVTDKDDAKGIAKAAKAMNQIFQKKGHAGMTNVLYVGYDNCDGRALARGTAIVEALTAAGVSCYRDEQED